MNIENEIRTALNQLHGQHLTGLAARVASTNALLAREFEAPVRNVCHAEETLRKVLASLEGKTQEPIPFTRIDGVNYVKRSIPNQHGTIELEGLTVRALIKSLSDCDQDDLVCYMAENTPESRASDLILGVVSGVLSEGNCGTSFMIGPEAVRAMKKAGVIQ